MTQENLKNTQEGVVGSEPKPFNPNDEARIAQLNAKFEGGSKQDQVRSDRFTVNDGLLSVIVESIVSNKDGLITFEASQVDNSDTTTQFRGGLSRDIRYAVFKQGDQWKVQKIFNPKGAEFVQDVRGEEVDAVLRSPTVAKYING